MASVRAKVKAELLEWARVSAGFTVEDAVPAENYIRQY
jgi:hypothetical protein